MVPCCLLVQREQRMAQVVFDDGAGSNRAGAVGAVMAMRLSADQFFRRSGAGKLGTKTLGDTERGTLDPRSNVVGRRCRTHWQKEDSELLDVGCDAGRPTARLAAEYPSLRQHGVHLDSSRIARAKRRTVHLCAQEIRPGLGNRPALPGSRARLARINRQFESRYSPFCQRNASRRHLGPFRGPAPCAIRVRAEIPRTGPGNPCESPRTSRPSP